MERNKGSMMRKAGMWSALLALFSAGAAVPNNLNVSYKGNYERRNPMYYGRNQRKKKTNKLHRSRMLKMKHRKTN